MEWVRHSYHELLLFRAEKRGRKKWRRSAQGGRCNLWRERIFHGPSRWVTMVIVCACVLAMSLSMFPVHQPIIIGCELVGRNPLR